MNRFGSTPVTAVLVSVVLTTLALTAPQLPATPSETTITLPGRVPMVLMGRPGDVPSIVIFPSWHGLQRVADLA